MEDNKSELAVSVLIDMKKIILTSRLAIATTIYLSEESQEVDLRFTGISTFMMNSSRNVVPLPGTVSLSACMGFVSCIDKPCPCFRRFNSTHA